MIGIYFGVGICYSFLASPCRRGKGQPSDHSTSRTKFDVSRGSKRIDTHSKGATCSFRMIVGVAPYYLSR